MPLSTKRRYGRANSGPTFGHRMLAGAIPVLAVSAMIAIYAVSNTHYQAQALHPRYMMLNFRDGSMSFSDNQFKKVLSVHDKIYSACFSGEPVSFASYNFGSGLEQTGSLVTSAPKDVWRVIDLPSQIDGSATEFAPALDLLDTLAARNPNTTIAALFESDGQATDWPALDAAAKRLGRRQNIAFIAVAGVIPSSRLRLYKAMTPLGERFAAFDLTDFNEATTVRLSALVAKTGGRK